MLDKINDFKVPVSLKDLGFETTIPKTDEVISDAKAGKIFESFGNMLKKNLEETSALDMDASRAKEVFATGGNISMHEVMITAEKAEMAMQLTLQLRNKLLSSYKEIQNMHV